MKGTLARIKATEPARVAEFGRTVLAGLVSLGWVTVDDTAVNTITSAAALLLSWGLTKFVRNRVTPVQEG